jgi:hypothetical protein
MCNSNFAIFANIKYSFIILYNLLLVPPTFPSNYIFGYPPPTMFIRKSQLFLNLTKAYKRSRVYDTTSVVIFFEYTSNNTDGGY